MRRRLLCALNNVTNELNNYNLPAGYQRVEYLESTGTQVIDTDIYPGDKDDGFDIKFVSLDTRAVYKPLLSFACAATNISERRNFGVDNNSFFILVSQPWIVFDKKEVTGETYIARGSCQYIKRISTLIVNDEPLNVRSDNNVLYHYANCGITYALFGQKTLYNDGVRFSSFGAWRVFYCKMYLEGRLVRDFIPCLDPTGAPCMFDLVSSKPFHNKGTGDFLYPTESSTYSLRRTFPDWGKLTENGLRRLYHAPAGYTGELYDYALENGYKPIVEPEKPEEGYWSPHWAETADEITLKWVETEAPEEFNFTPEIKDIEE